MDLRLGFLSSHNGTLVKAIVREINEGELIAQPKIIIGNNPNSGVLGYAKKSSIPGYCINPKNSQNPDKSILEKLQEYEVNFVLLAGYMKKVGEVIIDSYPNRILNIHRSLLPKYGGEGMYGKVVLEAILKSGDAETGATVHIVNSNYDTGRILAQYKFPVYQTDTIESLERRLLKVECMMYPQVLRDIQAGLINLDEEY